MKRLTIAGVCRASGQPFGVGPVLVFPQSGKITQRFGFSGVGGGVIASFSLGTGKDAGKRVPGRKRGLAVDALGLIIAVVVTAASSTDNAIGVDLLDEVVEHTRP